MDGLQTVHITQTFIMRTTEEFNGVHHLIIDGAGLGIEIPQVVAFINHVIDDLSKIEGFRLTEISTFRGIPRVQSNLTEILPWVGHLVHEELEEKLSIVMKVEFEVEARLKSLNLDINGKSLINE